MLNTPLFETTLAKMAQSLGKVNRWVDPTSDMPQLKPRPPAVFSAAGNRLTKGKVRVRLGYPASRPETIAATFVKTNMEFENVVAPVDWVDIPATHGLKPCVAINVDHMPIKNIKGSSFASAWLSGYYTSLIRSHDVEELDTLSKIAWLMQHTNLKRMPSGRGRLPCYGAMLSSKEKSFSRVNELHELIQELGNNFGADFCLHGSSAMISEWLRIHNTHLSELATWVHKDLGDIDLIYSGLFRRKSKFDKQKDQPISTSEIKRFVQDWIKQRINRAWVSMGKRLVQIHSYEGMTNSTNRLRCITPVTKLYLTQGGMIDVWGGTQDLAQGCIRFLPLTHPRFWARNKLYGSGADSIGLNILQWISPIVLLQLVSYAAKVEPPIPDPDSVSAIHQILDKVDQTKEIALLFGNELTDSRERLDRRFERVEFLMGSAVRQGIEDKTLNNLLSRLIQIRSSLEIDV